MDILSIEFQSNGRMRLSVQMPESGQFTTDGLPHLPERLFYLFPHLNKHKCHNDHGYSFKRECEDTELPHLLEHLIIELQSQAQPHLTLRGETVWNWRENPRGFFHVFVEYENELLALACVRLADRVIKAIDGRVLERLDIESEVQRLKDIARLGGELAAKLPACSLNSWSFRVAEREAAAPPSVSDAMPVAA